MSLHPTDTDPIAHLDDLAPPERRAEAHRLAALFAGATGFQPRLWSDGVVGYGRYAYRYASGRSGSCFATGFAARKREFSIHILPHHDGLSEPLGRLGRYRAGRSCLYLRRLDDIDEEVLREIIRAGLAELQRHWPVQPG